MSWLNSFELMCYIIVAILIISLIKKKDYNSLFVFASAALVGYFMELAAVAVTDIYHYNQDFWLNMGVAPKQFPVFGGLMWGGLTVCGIKLAEKLKFGKLMTAFSAGMFIVTMDILLDVVAIRLDGGFWTWVGNPINYEVTQSTFLSVIWVNFLGYMIETPAVVMFTQIKCEKIKDNDYKKQVIASVLIALSAIVITAVGSLAALGLNILTNNWFSCILFSLIWVFMALNIIIKMVKEKLLPINIKNWNFPMIIFWLAMYLYCIFAMIHLGIVKDLTWFFIVGLIFTNFTFYVSISEGNDK